MKRGFSRASLSFWCMIAKIHSLPHKHLNWNFEFQPPIHPISLISSVINETSVAVLRISVAILWISGKQRIVQTVVIMSHKIIDGKKQAQIVKDEVRGRV